MTGFSKLHPAVNLLFFVFVLAFAMFLSHPLVQLLGLLAAMLCAVCCLGGRQFLRRLLLLVPLMLFTALINPLLSHQGETVLFYFPTGSACTLESVLYGVFASVRLGTVLLWFVGWNTVITSDKFVFLFGRAIPALALTIAMGLRFVPRLLRRMREVSETQKCLHPQKSRLRLAGAAVSIVVTWALENALDTADTMKSRGYGVRKRTSFSIYRFSAQDAWAVGLLLLCGGMVLCAALLGGFSWEFFPTMSGSCGVWTVLGAAAFAGLSAFPFVFEGKEALQWRVSR